MRPLRGRLFLAEEYSEGRSNVVVLSYAVWQGRFGADERVVGSSISLEGQQYLVAGVLPRSFHADVTRKSTEVVPVREEFWAPQTVQEFERANRRTRYWSVVGQLATDVTFEQAQAELETISGRLAAEHPAMASMTATLVPAREHVAAPLREPLALLFAAIVTMLLIACGNVASLLVVRSAERHHEFAVRAAIGAARWRLVRQTLVEAAVLTLSAWCSRARNRLCRDARFRRLRFATELAARRHYPRWAAHALCHSPCGCDLRTRRPVAGDQVVARNAWRAAGNGSRGYCERSPAALRVGIDRRPNGARPRASDGCGLARQELHRRSPASIPDLPGPTSRCCRCSPTAPAIRPIRSAARSST